MLIKKIIIITILFFGASPAFAAEESVNFKFTVLGDSESMKTGFYPEMSQMVNLARKQNPDFAIFTGDIMATVSKNVFVYQDWINTFKRIVDSNFKKTYIAFGKHDMDCGFRCVNLWSKTLWGKTWGFTERAKLYHSFNYQNTHFVLLSSDYPLKHNLDAIQLNWLEEDLKKNTQPNKIVVTHVPPITFFEESAEECHDMSCNKASRDRLLNILQTYKVDLVISGHEHSFQHKNKHDIDFIISGNSGNSERYGVGEEDSFSLVEVNGTNITVKKIDKKERVDETIKVKP